MAVRLKFGRPGSPRKAAAIEPFSSALLGAFNEMTRRREIVWGHLEWTERRYDANFDLVREPLEIVNQPPRDQQGDCMQGPSHRPFWRLIQGASISSWKHDDPRRSEIRRHPDRSVPGDCAVDQRLAFDFEPVGRRQELRCSRGWRRLPVPSKNNRHPLEAGRRDVNWNRRVLQARVSQVLISTRCRRPPGSMILSGCLSRPNALLKVTGKISRRRRPNQISASLATPSAFGAPAK